MDNKQELLDFLFSVEFSETKTNFHLKIDDGTHPGFRGSFFVDVYNRHFTLSSDIQGGTCLIIPYFHVLDFYIRKVGYTEIIFRF